MSSAASLSPESGARSEPGWFSPFDPLALPPTDQFTLGQRKVLQACLHLFADQGFAGSSIRDIASAARLQSASLYNHFASKDQMLAALVLLGTEFHTDALMHALLNGPSDPIEQLATAVKAHVTVHCEYPRMALIVARESRFLGVDVMPQVNAYRERSASIIREILRRGTDQGVFELVGPHVTVLALASMGVDSARWFPYQSEISAEELAHDYARLTLRMVGVHA